MFTNRVSRQRRHLSMENLERRDMLSHPAVAAVNVASTSWSSAFVSHLESLGLGSGGYAVPVGSSSQLQTLPWTNIDQIRITFSEDVIIAAGDLSVSGANTTAYAFSSFSYDSIDHVATWTLSAPLAKDKLLLDLDADGLAPVRSVSTEDVLDGAWVNCQSVYNSGDSTGGTDFEFRLNVLPGDVNASNSVNVVDAALVNQQVGKGIGDTGYNMRYDIDGSGIIASSEVQAIQAKIGSVLPTGDPAGLNNDAPTTCGIADQGIALGAVDRVLALADFFDDAETDPDDLTYAVIQNTNVSLVDSTSIDSSGNLTLGLADNTTGDAILTIRATDAAGLFVDTTFEVHVSEAPVISEFACICLFDGWYLLSGTVADADDPVDGDIVHFGGVLAAYNLTATVESGAFTLYTTLPGIGSGTAVAVVVDPHGVCSEEAYDIILV